MRKKIRQSTTALLVAMIAVNLTFRPVCFSLKAFASVDGISASADEPIPSAPEETPAPGGGLTATPSEAEAPVCTVTGEHQPENFVFLEHGRHSSVCAVCGETTESDCVYAEEPVYVSDGAGSHYDCCLLCGGKRTEPCLFLEESFPHTEFDEGYTLYTCGRCGYQYKDGITEAENVRKESRLMGDVDRNGKVESFDARTVLRVSVRLDAIAPELLPFADIDADGIITSGDARRALRTSVKLENDLRHEYNTEVIKNKTCEEDGELVCSCPYCGESHHIVIPSIGHRFRVTAFEKPTCVDMGKETKVCSVCQKRTEMTAPALGHQWVDATETVPKHCSLCGEKITGLTKVGDKTVFFQKDGKVPAGRAVLYLDVNGEKGYWYLLNGVLDRTVRAGVSINGENWIVTEGKARKAVSPSDKTLFRAFQAVEKATTPDMTKEQKLRACFNYVKKAYGECSPRSPHYLGSDWPILYANDMFVNGRGNCFSYAAAFGFMAKAIGYTEVYGCNSTGHGWTEIDGRVYDPEWSKGHTHSTFFGIRYSDRVGVNYSVILPMIGRYSYAHVKI